MCRLSTFQNYGFENLKNYNLEKFAPPRIFLLQNYVSSASESWTVKDEIKAWKPRDNLWLELPLPNPINLTEDLLMNPDCIPPPYHPSHQQVVVDVTTLEMARKPVKLQKENPAGCAGEGKQSKGN